MTSPDPNEQHHQLFKYEMMLNGREYGLHGRQHDKLNRHLWIIWTDEEEGDQAMALQGDDIKYSGFPNFKLPFPFARRRY